MLKAIFFDWGWTLSDYPGVHEFNLQLKQEMGEDRYAIVRDAFIEAHERIVPADEWVRAVAERVNATPAEREKLKMKYFWPEQHLYPDTIPTLEMLKGRGMSIGVISNASVLLRPAIAQTGVQDYFKSIVISCEVGFRKPAKEIFEAGLQDLDVDPADALMVGDMLKADIVGAEAVGMNAVLLDRNNETEYPDKIRTLTEIERYL